MEYTVLRDASGQYVSADTAREGGGEGEEGNVTERVAEAEVRKALLLNIDPNDQQ